MKTRHKSVDIIYKVIHILLPSYGLILKLLSLLQIFFLEYIHNLKMAKQP
jgi:hypothetical protein